MKVNESSININSWVMPNMFGSLVNFSQTLETTSVFLLEGTELYLFPGKDFLWMEVPFANLNLVLAQELLRKGLVITLTFSSGLSLSPFFYDKKICW